MQYIKGIAKYIKNDKFYPDIIGKVSKASKSLCMWVRASALLTLKTPIYPLPSPSPAHLTGSPPS